MTRRGGNWNGSIPGLPADHHPKLADEMAAYDRLPDELRQFVAEAPFRLTVYRIENTWLMFGRDTLKALTFLRLSLADIVGKDWRPI